jgi:hypothetical protein
MNDPRFLNDPGMAEAMEPVREIHAIRLKLQDETAGMTAEEEIEYLNRKARESLARHGLSSRIVNLSGQGKRGKQGELK